MSALAGFRALASNAEKLADLVSQNPGLHMAALQEHSQMPLSTFSYNLRKLVAAQRVYQVSIGNRLHVFGSHVRPRFARQLALTASPESRELLRLLELHPELSFGDLARATGIGRRRLQSALLGLTEVRLVDVYPGPRPKYRLVRREQVSPALHGVRDSDAGVAADRQGR